jgi:AcrR family transcriptional regulator
MAYRRTEKMQKRVADRRRSIIEAAGKLFALEGYEATTMKKIADEAGTSIGNMYFYFPNKEELMINLISEIISDIWKHEFVPAHHDLKIDTWTYEAVDDYLKVHAFFADVDSIPEHAQYCPSSLVSQIYTQISGGAGSRAVQTLRGFF